MSGPSKWQTHPEYILPANDELGGVLPEYEGIWRREDVERAVRAAVQLTRERRFKPSTEKLSDEEIVAKAIKEAGL